MREGAAVILRPLTGYVPASCRPPSVQFVMFEAYHFAVPVPALQVSPKKMDLETALFGRARLESTPPPPPCCSAACISKNSKDVVNGEQRRLCADELFGEGRAREG